MTPYSHRIIITVGNPSFSWNNSIIWRRSRLVNEENSLHVRHHAFSRPFHAKIFVPRRQRRYFNQTFYLSHYPNGMIACKLCFFGSLTLLNIIPLVAPGILSTFFSIDSYDALKIVLNHRDLIEVSSFKDFSKNLCTFSYFCHHTAINSFSNWFICSDFGYFFYNKDFFAFCKVFFTSHIARGIIKMIAWPTSFLEKRLDFEITWLIWNANNPTTSPPWPKNIYLYLKRLLLIQNAWRMNLT